MAIDTHAPEHRIGALHSQRDERHLLPDQHLMDTGSIDAETIAESSLRYQVDIMGPVMPDTSWAAKEAGRFAHRQFLIDWQAKCVRCPAGHMSRNWGLIPDRHGKPTLRVRFPLAQCRCCSLHDQCRPVAAKVLNFTPE